MFSCAKITAVQKSPRHGRFQYLGNAMAYDSL